MSTALVLQTGPSSAAGSTSFENPYLPGVSAALVVLGDVLTSAALFVPLYGLRMLFLGSAHGSKPVHLESMLLLTLLFQWLFEIYPGISVSPVHELKRITLANTASLLCVSLFMMINGRPPVLEVVFVMAWAGGCLLTPAVRNTVRHYASRHSWWGYPAVVYGTSDAVASVVRRLQQNPEAGLRPVMAVTETPSAARVEGVPVLPASMLSGGRLKGIKHAVVAVPGLSSPQLANFLEHEANDFANVVIIPDLNFVWNTGAQTFESGGVMGIYVRNSLLHAGPRAAKRLIDLMLCALLVPVLLPLLAVISALIAIESGWPVFYSQKRLGQSGKPFHIWKFRTMLPNAATVLEQHLAANPSLRQEWEENYKLQNDPRITRIGKFLRKTSLDELPQLWNVVKGEMSLVGPRPIVREEVAKYKDVYALYTKTTPGVTGLWQVSGRSRTTYAERVAYDAYYVRNWSVWMDIYLLVRTISVVLTGEGAY